MIKLLPVVAQAQQASMLEAASGYRVTTNRIPVFTPNGLSEVVMTTPPSPLCGPASAVFSGR